MCCGLGAYNHPLSTSIPIVLNTVFADVDATVPGVSGRHCESGSLRQLHGDGRGLVRGGDQRHGRTWPGLQVSST